MAAAEAAAAAAAPTLPGEVKRPEGDEWCDSGLGSLGEGQLGPLPASPGPASPGTALGPVTAAVSAVRLAEPPEEEEEEEEEKRAASSPLAAAAVDPAAWLRHVLGFLTEDGDTALHLAVIHEHEAFLDSILQYTGGTEYLDLQNDLGQTALHIAVILGLSGFVRKLRAAGAGLCVQERGGHTALHLACREGRRGCARHLLGPPRIPPAPHDEETRAQLDSVNYDGYTPLHVAVLRKDLAMVELLLSAGADLNARPPGVAKPGAARTHPKRPAKKDWEPRTFLSASARSCSASFSFPAWSMAAACSTTAPPQPDTSLRLLHGYDAVARYGPGITPTAGAKRPSARRANRRKTFLGLNPPENGRLPAKVTSPAAATSGIASAERGAETEMRGRPGERVSPRRQPPRRPSTARGGKIATG
ncbi:NF-kappa-B inhibitor beta [Balearica regulorum gibbericeps]|uniref:NF-kappa-B inhibitor beta n=1 Tax=Balearica regulorum gibbericeps TaxID=100784 RepID=UPI003F5F2A07